MSSTSEDQAQGIKIQAKHDYKKWYLGTIDTIVCIITNNY